MSSNHPSADELRGGLNPFRARVLVSFNRPITYAQLFALSYADQDTLLAVVGSKNKVFSDFFALDGSAFDYEGIESLGKALMDVQKYPLFSRYVEAGLGSSDPTGLSSGTSNAASGGASSQGLASSSYDVQNASAAVPREEHKTPSRESDEDIFNKSNDSYCNEGYRNYTRPDSGGKHLYSVVNDSQLHSTVSGKKPYRTVGGKKPQSTVSGKQPLSLFAPNTSGRNTKRKRCMNCTISHQPCDLARPTCSICARKGKDCVYEVDENGSLYIRPPTSSSSQTTNFSQPHPQTQPRQDQSSQALPSQSSLPFPSGTLQSFNADMKRIDPPATSSGLPKRRRINVKNVKNEDERSEQPKPKVPHQQGHLGKTVPFPSFPSSATADEDEDEDEDDDARLATSQASSLGAPVRLASRHATIAEINARTAVARADREARAAARRANNLAEAARQEAAARNPGSRAARQSSPPAEAGVSRGAALSAQLMQQAVDGLVPRPSPPRSDLPEDQLADEPPRPRRIARGIARDGATRYPVWQPYNEEVDKYQKR